MEIKMQGNSSIGQRPLYCRVSFTPMQLLDVECWMRLLMQAMMMRRIIGLSLMYDI